MFQSDSRLVDLIPHWTRQPTEVPSAHQVPPQRAPMSRVLACPAGQLSGRFTTATVVAATVEAVGERGSLRTVAIQELLWECLVWWDRDTMSLDSVQLKLSSQPPVQT